MKTQNSEEQIDRLREVLKWPEVKGSGAANARIVNSIRALQATPDAPDTEETGTTAPVADLAALASCRNEMSTCKDPAKLAELGRKARILRGAGKLFASLALMALCVTARAQALYEPVPLTVPGTTAAATTSTVTNQVMDCRGFQNVTLLTKFNFSDVTTSNVVYTVSKSLDRSLFETTGSTWTVAGNGTNDVIATTTIATGGAGWLKLSSIQNTHGSLVLTNKLFEYSIKRAVLPNLE